MYRRLPKHYTLYAEVQPEMHLLQEVMHWELQMFAQLQTSKECMTIPKDQIGGHILK